MGAETILLFREPLAARIGDRSMVLAIESPEIFVPAENSRIPYSGFGWARIGICFPEARVFGRLSMLQPTIFSGENSRCLTPLRRSV